MSISIFSFMRDALASSFQNEIDSSSLLDLLRFRLVFFLSLSSGLGGDWDVELDKSAKRPKCSAPYR